MAAVILLSSSPPRIFAPSPTQAESPRSFHSHDARNETPICSRTNFKTLNTDRDGWSPPGTTGRRVLSNKTGAKNSPVGTSARNKFKQSLKRAEKEEVTEVRDASLTARALGRSQSHQNNPARGTDYGGSAQSLHIQIRPGDVRKRKAMAAQKKSEKLHLAIPRETDWTKPGTDPFQSSEGGLFNSPAHFHDSLLKRFEQFENHRSRTVATTNTEDSSFEKRRKLDNSPATPLSKAEVFRQPNEPASNLVAKNRSKSPTKKALTITGLATSNYVGGAEDKTTPMMQYLALTQAQATDNDSDSAVLQTKMRKSRKPNASKKAKMRSSLVSPKTALKTFEDQEVIFASASQLARDDSPSLLRDTVEALKLSEGDLVDVVGSSQTAPISIGSDTPRSGVQRFRGRRNLWGAGDRDEDEALLHVDELADTSLLKRAFAGKDALVEVGCDPSIVLENTIPTNSLHLLQDTSLATVNVDDFTTKIYVKDTPKVPTIHKRNVHTGTRGSETSRSKAKTDVSRPARGTADLTEATEAVESLPKHPKPTLRMPNYTTFTDDELKRQLAEHGIRRMRKRENMIGRLKDFWITEHGVEEEELQAEMMRPGDFLSKIHHFSDRPQPKAKKPRRRKKLRTSVDDIDAASICKDRGQLKDNEARPSEEGVLDVDDFDESIELDKASLMSMSCNDDETEIPSFTGVGRSSTKRSTAKSNLPTPPSTVPTVTITSSPAFEDIPGQPTHALTSPKQSFITDESDRSELIESVESSQELPDIKQQVERAVKHTSSSDRDVAVQRNHQINPTFHEKILLYDPIILEDITAWLNTEGLNSIGEDREVDIMDVRAWCEENGICCLWKGGWRGRGLKGKMDGNGGLDDL